jgi:hypothetical protein
MNEVTKQWKPGQSGNQLGRPRAKFVDAFIGDVAQAWEKHGGGVLEQMAASEPAKFADLCSRLIPRDVSLKLAQPQVPYGLSPENWHVLREIATAVKQEVPDAGSRPPGEVLKFVADAIRAHTARTIE